MVETIAIVSAIIALVVVATWTPAILWMYFTTKNNNEATNKQLDAVKAAMTALANQPHPSEERLQALEGKLTAFQMQRR